MYSAGRGHEKIITCDAKQPHAMVLTLSVAPKNAPVYNICDFQKS